MKQQLLCSPLQANHWNYPDLKGRELDSIYQSLKESQRFCNHLLNCHSLIWFNTECRI